MSEPLLQVAGLDISVTGYGRVRKILSGVGLEIGKGERVALIGETGSGKSMTAKAILGTLPDNARIEAGTLSFEGQDLLSLGQARREALKGQAFSIIMQDPQSSFNPVFTIGQHLEDVLVASERRQGMRRSRAERWEHIHEVLQQVQLRAPDLICRSYPMQLSGGMRQRVLIALALMHRPRLLIADEPGTALDVTVQQEILDLINGLVAEHGLSLLVITHNLGVVRRMADRVYVMRKGEVVDSGALRALFSGRQHSYTRELMDAVPPLYGPRVETQPPSHGAPVVRLEGVGKTYVLRRGLADAERIVAVAPTDLTVNDGEIFGLAGESGSGKTTIARIIAGLVQPSSGNVRLTLKGLDGLEERGRRGARGPNLCQIVYQNPGSSLNPRRTAGQTLSVPLDHLNYRGQRREARIAELLRKVQLDESFASKYPHELSGGQKQRLAIARALAAEPRIILLDEPTSALDVAVQKSIVELLVLLRSELGMTFLVISHDLALMRNFCSRMAIMHRGRIVEAGETATVFAYPKHPYTRALIAAVPVLTEEEEAQKPSVTSEERQRFLVSTGSTLKSGTVI